MKWIRKVLGALILFFDQLFSPKSLQRPAEEQKRVDEETSTLVLYQFRACPFCVKVRRAVKRLNLKIELRDILKDKESEAELIEKGGQRQVPCLKITSDDGERWMYESGDIIAYLDNRFGSQRPNG